MIAAAAEQQTTTTTTTKTYLQPTPARRSMLTLSRMFQEDHTGVDAGQPFSKQTSHDGTLDLPRRNRLQRERERERERERKRGTRTRTNK